MAASILMQTSSKIYNLDLTSIIFEKKSVWIFTLMNPIYDASGRQLSLIISYFLWWDQKSRLHAVIPPQDILSFALPVNLFIFSPPSWTVLFAQCGRDAVHRLNTDGDSPYLVGKISSSVTSF